MSPQPKSLKQLEESNGHRVSLPLSVFDPVTTSSTANYRRQTLTDPRKSFFISLSLCHNAWQRLFIYQEKTDAPSHTEYVLAADLSHTGRRLLS